MSPLAWILCGFSLGMIFGAVIVLIWVKEQLIAYHQDSENHRHAAMSLARKLSVANVHIDYLKEQIGGLHAELESDPADAWKEQA